MGNSLSMTSAFIGQSFRIPTPPLTEKNLPDQSGKVFIITGGYAGVGAQLSQILYAANATIYIAGRSESKASAAISSIQSSSPNSRGKLHFLQIDFSDLTTIKAAADRFLASETKLHWLNNNAGVMVPPVNSTGAQGRDVTYQTNILGPFLFTKLLLPVLKSTARSAPKGSVRVSWAGSLAVDLSSPSGGVEFTPDGTDLAHGLTSPQLAYGTSKAANYLLATEFGRRSGDDDGVLHNSYNPGNLKTELQRHAKQDYAFAVNVMTNILCYAPIFGAYTELFAGLSPDLTIEKDQGVYVVPWGRPSALRSDVMAERGAVKGDKAKAAVLYDWCDGVTGKFA